MRSLTAAACALAAGACLALALDGRTLAHAQLESISPANGEVVSAPPVEVVLTFNEPVSLTGGDARVFNDAATVVSATPVQSGVTVTIPLPADLPDGTYTVTFQVISADSHRIAGASVFHVGAASSQGLDPAALGERTDVAWGIRLGAIALTGVAYGAMLLAIGLWFFGVAIDRPPRGGERALVATALIVRSAVLGAVMLVGSVPFRIARVGGGLDALRDDDVLAAELQGPIGQAVAVGALALVAFALVVDRRATAWIAGPIALIAAGSFSLEGHSRAIHLRWAMIMSDVVHLAAGAVWLGGIAALILAFRRRVDAGPLAVLVRRFSNAALVAVAVVSASGVVMAWIVLPTVGELTSTGYGLALVMKVALVIVVIALGAFNRWLLVPSVSGPDARLRLKQIVSAELGLLAVVVGTTAVLVTRSPVASSAAVPAPASGPVAEPAGPTTTAAPQVTTVELSDGGSVEVSVTPAQVGTNRVDLVVRDREGRVINPIEAPSAEFEQIDLGIGPLRPDVTPTYIGEYTMDADLAVAGEWEVTIRVRTGEFDSVIGTTTIHVAEARPSAE
jgi:copper transport protein